MQRYIRLIGMFMRASVQQETAYRANFFIAILHASLNLGTGVLGTAVLFEQVDSIHGWDFASTLVVLGIFLTVGALRDLFISPSLEALAGMEGEIWTGRFDFTLLRPVDVQFYATFQRWRVFALLNVALGAGVLVVGILEMSTSVSIRNLLSFVIALSAGIGVFYAILLGFTALVFWSPGFLFTWVFDGLFQMARYPVKLYPGWLRLVLTWIIPVGLITTVPAQALTGDLGISLLVGSVALAGGLFAAASLLFRTGLRRYASASS